jgi:outer membrane lipoprotein-sorting protein
MKTGKAFSMVIYSAGFILLVIFLSTSLMVQTAYGQYSPSAEKILNHYVRVTGGADAYEKIRNRVTRTEVEIEGSNISLNITMMAKKPNLVKIVTESPATGKVVSGCNGETVWELSDVKGPIVKKGREKENALHLNTLDRFACWKEVYRKAEFKGVKEMNGHSCFVVYVEPYEADPQTLYFDRASKLLVALETKMKSEMGNLPILSYFEDYREVDGVTLPFMTRVMVASQVMVSRVKSVEHNVSLDSNLFALPDEIRDLVDRQG